MECEMCLRTSDEGYEIRTTKYGMKLCRECCEVMGEVDRSLGYIDEGLPEMEVWDDDLE